MEQINFNDYAIKLSKGAHANPKEGMCIMEVIAYIEGEKHTDHPKCACPIVTEFAIRTNDWMTDEERELLLPYVLRIAGSKATSDLEQQRTYMAADYAIRVFAPIGLRTVRLETQAKNLEACAKIVDQKTAIAGKKAAYVAVSAAAYAANATAYVAYAAANAAYAAANATYADAAANAAYAAVRIKIVNARLALLDDMLKLTNAVEATPVIEVKLQELVTKDFHVQ